MKKRSKRSKSKKKKNGAKYVQKSGFVNQFMSRASRKDISRKGLLVRQEENENLLKTLAVFMNKRDMATHLMRDIVNLKKHRDESSKDMDIKAAAVKRFYDKITNYVKNRKFEIFLVEPFGGVWSN